MRSALVFLASLFIAGSLVLSGYVLKQRFQQGAKTRIAICQSENLLRKILNDEHEKKLRTALSFLQIHPNGIPGISRDLILQGISNEREIVAQTQAKVCT